MTAMTLPHSLSFAVATLFIGFSMPAAAQKAEPAKGEPAWLDGCMEQGGNTLEYARCMVVYRTDLQDAQAVVLERIDRALKRPALPGTDYKAAAAQVVEAQKHWQAYVEADCRVIDHVFGHGTALGLAGEDCIIKHYEARIANLYALEENHFVQEGLANLPVRP